MMYPQYAFQHSVLVIDHLSNSELLVRGGLLSYPVNFEFCPGDQELALKKIIQSKPDLLLVSVEFEKGNILEFAQKTQELHSTLPAIFMTNPKLTEIQNSIVSLGAFDFILHPGSEPKELIRRMDRALSVTRKYRNGTDSYRELREASRAKGRAIAELLDENNEFSPA
jgi:DNA-binding NtrC family response regulator